MEYSVKNSAQRTNNCYLSLKHMTVSAVPTEKPPSGKSEHKSAPRPWDAQLRMTVYKTRGKKYLQSMNH